LALFIRISGLFCHTETRLNLCDIFWHDVTPILQSIIGREQMGRDKSLELRKCGTVSVVSARGFDSLSYV
jgi:hypothetical protein